ncbi:MAG: hypothetical protein ACR2NA_09605 [Solirubrobacterales bacterium]
MRWSDFNGFGFKHIRAKHGWSQTDSQETVHTLAADLAPGVDGQQYTYVASVAPGAGGVSCQRRVVVDYQHRSGDPAPAGIITSYNKVVE